MSVSLASEQSLTREQNSYQHIYFTMLGWQVTGKSALTEETIDILSELILQHGFIPYKAHPQPPYFALILSILQESRKTSVLSQYQAALEKEYHFWMEGSDQVTTEQPVHKSVVRMPNGCILNRYPPSSDEQAAEEATGWAGTKRWQQGTPNPFFNTIPVDLNCLLLFYEATLLSVYQEQNDKEQIDRMLYQILRREKTIQQYCWDKDRGFFTDYDFGLQQFSEALTLAGIYPLFFKLASGTQAKQALKLLETVLLEADGLAVTLNKDAHIKQLPVAAVMQWISYKGLMNYHLLTAAVMIRERWMQANTSENRDPVATSVYLKLQKS
ncbi:trehalase family glycosidase [Sediminibacterium ginsengisoli]|uniref:Trehalase n=1 Tax=Sediminibacterium ginsengisoli TaxID=413434 RepID=A0A1T4L1W7_9BACT|nr:trehalase family glycosidase [Sediminibacterium ginsengisoli]SJZ48537.1 Trehalase [Sediminibacterium ginsengisoli]